MAPTPAREAIAGILYNALKAVRLQTLAGVEHVWRSLDDYRNADIDTFVQQVVPLVLGGERTTATLTASFLAQYIAAGGGDPSTPAAVDFRAVTGAALRGGVDPYDVYTRAGAQVYASLARGRTFSQAIEDGLRRALGMAATDLQLAKTHSARGLFRSTKIVGYRRVLTGTYSCGLCVIASTQRYRRGDLMPIHPGCDCMVLPIIGSSDPGQVLDHQTLDSAHASVAERFKGVDFSGRDIASRPYRDLIITHEHGEIGPVLGVRGQDFTGPRDLAA